MFAAQQSRGVGGPGRYGSSSTTAVATGAARKAPESRNARNIYKILPVQAPLAEQDRIAQFRFWHDEKRFRGSGDESLAQHTLLAAGGVRMGGNPKEAPTQGPMGWQTVDSWDILWSTSDGAHKAAPLITPGSGQLINALPGLEQLTRKRNLAVTLQAAYGDEAWTMVPRSYSLPTQLLQWRQRLADEVACLLAAKAAGHSGDSQDTPEVSLQQQQQQQDAEEDSAASTEAASAANTMGPITGWWVLKTGEHLGQGLQVVPSSKALSCMLQRNKHYLQQPKTAYNQQPPQQLPQQGQASGLAEGRTASNSSSSGDAAAATDKLPVPRVSAGGTAASPAAATEGAAASTAGQDNRPRPFISVQQYITQPLLIDGRKFGLRVWVMVLGPQPFRAYVYKQGLVLFSSQQYNPDLEAVATEGAAAQGHLTNAALWQQTSTNTNMDSSDSSSSSTRSVQQYPDQSIPQGASNPGTSSPRSSTASRTRINNSSSSRRAPSPGQPVWALQQLFDVLGPQQADAIWQKIKSTAGKVVAAAGGHVHQAAQQLSWSGDAAFELLGLDFLLDSSLHPWLLEANASPSLAWSTPGDRSTSQLLWEVKQEMLTDMFALLRLQDRYPKDSQNRAETAQQQQPHPPQFTSVSVSTDGQRRHCQQAETNANLNNHHGASQQINPVLLQAASAQYFKARQQVVELVVHDAQQLAAAVAAAPSRQQIELQIEQVLDELEQQQQMHQQHQLLQQQQHQEQPYQVQQQVHHEHKVDVSLLRTHFSVLVHIESELQSCQGWQSLLQQMPLCSSTEQQGGVKQGREMPYSSADAAIRAWMLLRGQSVISVGCCPEQLVTCSTCATA